MSDDGYNRSSISSSRSSTLSSDANVNRQSARRAAEKFKGSSPGDLPIPSDYRLPSRGAADNYATAPNGKLPKTGQAADGYHSGERIFRRLISGAEGSTLADLDY